MHLNVYRKEVSKFITRVFMNKGFLSYVLTLTELYTYTIMYVS